MDVSCDLCCGGESCGARRKNLSLQAKSKKNQVSCVSKSVQAWLALDPQRFRALFPASWDDLALVSGWVLIF